MPRARNARPPTTGAEALERIVDRAADPSELALDVGVVRTLQSRLARARARVMRSLCPVEAPT